jgi:hypothetical protein
LIDAVHVYPQIVHAERKDYYNGSATVSGRCSGKEASWQAVNLSNGD